MRCQSDHPIQSNASHYVAKLWKSALFLVFVAVPINSPVHCAEMMIFVIAMTEPTSTPRPRALTFQGRRSNPETCVCQFSITYNHIDWDVFIVDCLCSSAVACPHNWFTLHASAMVIATAVMGAMNTAVLIRIFNVGIAAWPPLRSEGNR